MRSVVLDASCTLAGHLHDEESLVAREFFRTLPDWEAHAPAIWPLEVANGLLVACRRGRLSTDAAERILRGLGAYDFQIDRETSLDRTLHLWSLARRHELSIYDAAYLELALRLGAALATLDRKLSRAAESAGLALAVGR